MKKLLIFFILFLLFSPKDQIHAQQTQDNSCKVSCSQGSVCSRYSCFDSCDKISDSSACDSTQTKCFWYSGGTEWLQPRCVVNSGNMKDQCGSGHCYNTQTCNTNTNSCYPIGSSPSSGNTLPTNTPIPTATPQEFQLNININYKGLSGFKPNTLSWVLLENDTFRAVQLPGVSSIGISAQVFGTKPLGPYTLKSGKYAFRAQLSYNDNEIKNITTCPSGPGNPVNTCLIDLRSNQTFDVTIDLGQASTTPTKTPTNIPQQNPGREGPVSEGQIPPKNVTPPPVTTKGWCADGNRENAKTVNGGACDIKNNTRYNAAFDNYCHNEYGSPSDFYFECADAGGGPSDPKSQTSPSPTPQYPCQNQNGVKEYLGSFCDNKSWNSDDATKGTFCSATYTDKYMCNDGKEHNFATDPKTLPGGVSPCSQTPWCKASSTVTPSTSPSPATKDPQYAYEGESCEIKSCYAADRLECVGTSPGKVCRYKNGIGPTATPGAASNCKANATGGGIGCACGNAPSGCTSGSCYPAVGGNLNDNTTWFCSTGSGKWCEASKTEVTNGSLCTAPTGTTTTKTPTPTSAPDLSYQAECPNVNSDGTTNVCATSCGTGFTPRPSGDRVCNEFTFGQNPKCCTQTSVGANTPTPTRAFTPATPTPTPLTSSSKPAGPYISFESVAACPAGHTGYWRGTYCDTDKVYYDVYCENGVKKRSPIGSITCQ